LTQPKVNCLLINYSNIFSNYEYGELMSKTMVIRLALLLSVIATNIQAQQASPILEPAVPQHVVDFYAEVMNAPPFQAVDMRSRQIGGVLQFAPSASSYLSSAQVDYFRAGWEQRIAKDGRFFTAPKALGRILVIDYKAESISPNAILSYRYLANQDSENELYEPWSSSKIFAYSAAVAKVRQLSAGEFGGQSLAGNIPIADLITSIHSYEPFGLADGDSNAIATYFMNVAGRDHLTALFHDQWLMLTNPSIRFRGAYANKVFEPIDSQWHQGDKLFRVDYPTQSIDDLGYQSYRCEHCGLTGNKPMTTLAQAEWLKRLAVHERDPVTRLPYLQSEDVQVLFFGKGHSDTKHVDGGMLQGISTMLHNAIATAIAGELPSDPKKVLDQATQGQWRIWQKIGWGPSETRGAGENVVLAHVSLPHFQGGLEFTLAAQSAEPGDGDIYVNYAGIKMQSLLTQSMLELFAANQVVK
jgi:hypothetical protein